jgi:hypothetical protein
MIEDIQNPTEADLAAIRAMLPTTPEETAQKREQMLRDLIAEGERQNARDDLPALHRALDSGKLFVHPAWVPAPFEIDGRRREWLLTREPVQQMVDILRVGAGDELASGLLWTAMELMEKEPGLSSAQAIRLVLMASGPEFEVPKPLDFLSE